MATHLFTNASTVFLICSDGSWFTWSGRGRLLTLSTQDIAQTTLDRHTGREHCSAGATRNKLHGKAKKRTRAPVWRCNVADDACACVMCRTLCVKCQGRWRVLFGCSLGCRACCRGCSSAHTVITTFIVLAQRLQRRASQSSTAHNDRGCAKWACMRAVMGRSAMQVHILTSPAGHVCGTRTVRVTVCLGSAPTCTLNTIV